MLAGIFVSSVRSAVVVIADTEKTNVSVLDCLRRYPPIVTIVMT